MIMSKFFKHGEVAVTAYDTDSRAAALQTCMPCWLMQTVTPIILGYGLIDKFKVHVPLAIWLPKLPSERFLDEYTSQLSDLPSVVSSQESKIVKNVLETFVSLSRVVKDPTDLVPMLPLGIYVDFQYRMKIDDMPVVLSKLNELPIAGVQEYAYAMAEVLAGILKQ
jgi:hypothetical protein